VDFWLRVAFIIVHPHAQLVRTLVESITFRSKNRMNDYLSEEDYQNIRSQGWPLTGKSLEQKKAIYRKCSISGIKQTGGTYLSHIDTHISSVLQLLFMSRGFPELLRKY